MVEATHDKIYTKDEAIKLGFDLDREKALKDTGWSKATLGRKLKKMEVGKHFVIAEGKTKPTPMFSQAIFDMSDVEIAEPVGAETPEPKKIVSKSTQENVKKNSEFDFNVFLLPYKMSYTLPEAKAISGLPMNFIKTFATFTSVGYLIEREKLEECKAAFFKLPPKQLSPGSFKKQTKSRRKKS